MKTTVVALLLIAAFQGRLGNSNEPRENSSAQDGGIADNLELAGRRAPENMADRVRREAAEKNRKEQIEKGRKEAKEAVAQLAEMTKQLSQEMDAQGQGVISSTLFERLNKMEKLLKVIKSNAKSF